MASSIPGAVQYLISLANVQPANLPANTLVWYGKELGVFVAPVTFQITGVTGDQEWAELGGLKREETYSVACSITTFAGDTDFISRMNEAMNAFHSYTLAIAADFTLGGAVRVAEWGDFNITSGGDLKGQSLCALDFNIRCAQRIQTNT